MDERKKYRSIEVNTPKKVHDFVFETQTEDNHDFAMKCILQSMSENKIIQAWESVVLLLNSLEKSYLKEMTLTEIKAVLNDCKLLYDETN